MCYPLVIIVVVVSRRVCRSLISIAHQSVFLGDVHGGAQASAFLRTEVRRVRCPKQERDEGDARVQRQVVHRDAEAAGHSREDGAERSALSLSSSCIAPSSSVVAAVDRRNHHSRVSRKNSAKRHAVPEHCWAPSSEERTATCMWKEGGKGRGVLLLAQMFGSRFLRHVGFPPQQEVRPAPSCRHSKYHRNIANQKFLFNRRNRKQRETWRKEIYETYVTLKRTL